jgi:hypothetical protein
MGDGGLQLDDRSPEKRLEKAAKNEHWVEAGRCSEHFLEPSMQPVGDGTTRIRTPFLFHHHCMLEAFASGLEGDDFLEPSMQPVGDGTTRIRTPFLFHHHCMLEAFASGLEGDASCQRRGPLAMTSAWHARVSILMLTELSHALSEHGSCA